MVMIDYGRNVAMKKLPLILAASLIANATLLAIVLSHSKEDQPTRLATASHAGNTRPSGNIQLVSEELSEADTASLVRSQELLAIDDLPRLVARLRTAGFSPMDIRGIVSARLSEQFGARRKAAVAELDVVPYWQGISSFPRNPQVGAEVTRLFREQKDRLKQLLGPDADPTDEWSQMLREREYGYLPPDKVDRMQTILADYKELRSSIFQNSYGVNMPEDQEKLQLIEKEQRADLEALFTPEELEAYDMRTSTIAGILRNNLKAFHPTEEEYHTIYRLTKAANSDLETPRVFPVRQANNPDVVQLQNEIEAALGPERAEAFRLATDPDYIQADRFATRLGLPDTTTAQLYSTAKDFKERLQTIQSNNTLPVETRAGQLKALAIEAEQHFTSLLGQRGFQAYEYQGGQWIKNLKGQPADTKQSDVINLRSSN